MNARQIEELKNSISDKLQVIIATAQNCIKEGAVSMDNMRSIEANGKQLAILVGKAMGVLKAYQAIAGR